MYAGYDESTDKHATDDGVCVGTEIETVHFSYSSRHEVQGCIQDFFLGGGGCPLKIYVYYTYARNKLYVCYMYITELVYVHLPIM